MEEIKFGKQVSLFEFVTTGMINKSKTLDNFLELHRLYNVNKTKTIKFSSQRFIFEESEFSLAITDTVPVKKKMKMAMIAAVGSKNELGSNGDLIWKIPEDMKRFKELTMGHFIIMGRKTFESFKGYMLPKRVHIVISRTMGEWEENENLYIFRTIEEAVEWINGSAHGFPAMNQEKYFCIGGGEIYKQMIDNADELYITRILNEIIEVPIDAYFPVIDMNKFQIVGNLPREFNGLRYYFTDMLKFTNKVDVSKVMSNKIINKMLINYLIANLK